MEKLELTPIGQIVASNYNTARVFTAHNMDFCCGGGITLSKACQKQGIDLKQVIEELESVLKTGESPSLNLEYPDQLIDNIINVHHRYIETTIPTLFMYLEKICHAHGEQHPELWQVKNLFEEGAGALTAHLKKEELILFPFIKAMVASKKDDFKLSAPHFGDIENPLQLMEHEHSIEGDRFKKISELTNNYKIPEDACQTYMVAFSMLKEFEEDLHKHIHLENNVLFPHARQLFNEFEF